MTGQVVSRSVKQSSFRDFCRPSRVVTASVHVPSPCLGNRVEHLVVVWFRDQCVGTTAGVTVGVIQGPLRVGTTTTSGVWNLCVCQGPPGWERPQQLGCDCILSGSTKLGVTQKVSDSRGMHWPVRCAHTFVYACLCACYVARCACGVCREGI